MMIDILKCHQPNKDGIVKMMYRADFCGLQRLEITITNGGIVRGLLSHCIRVLMITHSLDVGISPEVKNRTAVTGGLFFLREIGSL